MSRRIMNDVILYGPHWSAYTRTVRMALVEKQVSYQLEEVDFLRGDMPVDQVERHPFAKVPTLQHGDYCLYETAAICRYIDIAFPGCALQPVTPRSLGRMAQIIGVLDAYLSEPARIGFASELLIKPLMGFAPDADLAAQAEVQIVNSFKALSDCMDSESGDFLVGDRLSLADLHAVPMIDYIDRTPGGSSLIAKYSRLYDWWCGIRMRPSVIDTQPDLSVFEVAKRS